MVDGAELRRKRGAATVLALLVSFLFGYAPAAAQVDLDRSARLAPAELTKRTATLRTTVRSQADDDADLILAPPPLVHTELVSIQPTGETPSVETFSEPGNPPLAYRARAPPAA